MPCTALGQAPSIESTRITDRLARACCDSIESQHALDSLISRALMQEKPASTFSQRALESAGVYQSDGGSVESAGDHIAIPKLPAARLGILRKNESDLLVNGRNGLMEHGDGLAA